MKKFSLEDKVAKGLEHCVEDYFFCIGCPYKPLESSQFPLRCVHALLTDIQKLQKENKQ